MREGVGECVLLSPAFLSSVCICVCVRVLCQRSRCTLSFHLPSQTRLQHTQPRQLYTDILLLIANTNDLTLGFWASDESTQFSHFFFDS